MNIFFYVFIILFNLIWFGNLGCDIYITSKCPPPAAENQVNLNWTVFCEETKGHVDCINKKLKQCKKIQEFGPALETIKWNIKIIIKQVIILKCFISIIILKLSKSRQEIMAVLM